MAIAHLVFRNSIRALLALAALSAGGFAPLQAPPTVSSVFPLSGPAVGGTTITLTGTNLAGATNVWVGTTPATTFTVVSSTTVTAVTPAGTGSGVVKVRTPDGDGILLGSVFTYIDAPTITAAPDGVWPSAGPTVGGMPFIVEGTDLTGATLVTVGGVPATGVVVVNSTKITAVSPAGTTGLQAVSVTTPGGTATQLDAMELVNVTVPAWATPLEIFVDDVVVTRSHIRDAIEFQERPWRVRDIQTGIEFVLIPPAIYDMGCSDSDYYPCAANELPVHAELVSSAFYMARTEVTQAQWTARMGSNPSSFRSNSFAVPLALVPNRPVERVNFLAIQNFLAVTGARLPTEAEWEYACRADTETAFHGWGAGTDRTNSGTNDDSLLPNIAWYSRNSIYQTRPVAQRSANGFGLFDMSGNVAEWVSDEYALYESDGVGGPVQTGTPPRVVRGGAWRDASNNCRSSRRLAYPPSTRSNTIGFRVVKDP